MNIFSAAICTYWKIRKVNLMSSNKYWNEKLYLISIDCIALIFSVHKVKVAFHSECFFFNFVYFFRKYLRFEWNNCSNTSKLTKEKIKALHSFMSVLMCPGYYKIYFGASIFSDVTIFSVSKPFGHFVFVPL